MARSSVLQCNRYLLAVMAIESVTPHRINLYRIQQGVGQHKSSHPLLDESIWPSARSWPAEMKSARNRLATADAGAVLLCMGRRRNAAVWLLELQNTATMAETTPIVAADRYAALRFIQTSRTTLRKCKEECTEDITQQQDQQILASANICLPRHSSLLKTGT